MKSIIISIQPKWCELIALGDKNFCLVNGIEYKPEEAKTIEVRKTAPKVPFKAYIYQTKKKWIYKLLAKLGLWQGKVIGEFVCYQTDAMSENLLWRSWDNTDNYMRQLISNAKLTEHEFLQYAGEKTIYALHISDLKMYDKPKKLSEFKHKKVDNRGNWKQTVIEQIETAPQSWLYCEELEEDE